MLGEQNCGFTFTTATEQEGTGRKRRERERENGILGKFASLALGEIDALWVIRIILVRQGITKGFNQVGVQKGFSPVRDTDGF